MSEKMFEPPIFYTAAQIRFSPVMDMEKSISELQSIWRSQFPDFSQQLLNQIQFNPTSAEESKLKQTSIARWHFKDISGMAGLMLTTDSLIFHTTQYGTSTQFIDTLITALGELHKTVSLAYVDAVGFRSLDAIVPDQNLDLSFFLKNSLLGLYPCLEGTLRRSVSELFLQRDQLQLVSRCILLSGGIGIPGDLFPILLNFQSRFQEIDCIHAVLDNDAARTDRFPFDLKETANRLREVKTAISEAFYKAVTDDAIAYWKDPKHGHVSTEFASNDLAHASVLPK
jgi:uncharacterized protein (TIGR04255 family)